MKCWRRLGAIGDTERCKLPLWGPALHRYTIELTWTGNLGEGTASYRSYSRDYRINCDDKPPIDGSSDPAFRGDARRWNPEELLLASIAACHKLWYLHLCADAGICVVDYRDAASAVMKRDDEGVTRIVEATLSPQVTLAAGQDEAMATMLHERANAECFIASSVKFPIVHRPTVLQDN